MKSFKGERLLATMHELAQSRDGWVLKLGNGENDAIMTVGRDFHVV